MSKNLESNPFSGLFTSINEAENFTRRSECETNKNNASESEIYECQNEIDRKREEISHSAQESLEINQIVEDVFNITLKSGPRKTRTGDHLVYLGDLSSAIAPQDWIDLGTLEQALFERLLLDDPNSHVISGGSTDSSTKHKYNVEKDVILYLFECHKRLSEMKSKVKDNRRSEILSTMIGFVLQDVATALQQPDLFDGQQFHTQILELFATDISNSDLGLFFDGVSQQFLLENSESEAINLLTNAFSSTLHSVYINVAKSNLFTFNRSYFSLLQIFSSNSLLALVLLRHSTPKEIHSGSAYANTLFGSIMSLSCLPKNQDGLYEFFDKPLLQSTTAVEGNIWTALEFIGENLHKIFHSLLKCSSEVKHQTLSWIGNCLHANAARGKIWNTHAFNIGSPVCVSDGFMLNLCSILLHLCQPFCADPNDTRLLRIDPTYYAATVNEDVDARSKGVHMRARASETCLIPVVDGVSRPEASNYGFVSECFFLAHRALDLGFRVSLERLMRLNQDIARMQRAFNDVQSQAGSQSDVVQAIGEQMEMEMTRYLSLRAALLEPCSLRMMGQLHVATAVWLVQVTLYLDNDHISADSYMPSTFREVKFPLPEQVPLTLSCVPEFLIENIAGFLSFVRRFNPRALEEQGFSFLNPLLTLVLVFMGSSERMRNPHLRARMAECLESLLPRHNEDQPQALNPNPLGCFFREQLFKEHPHRKQIVLSVLDVFVGIEMTGQSVAFEQKFNYRRPMYVVMDYLWQIEEHKECFKALAVDAEQNMEAVTPPLFLRFINLLMNDAVFLLDDALSNMAKLRQMHAAREAGEWQNLPIHEREQNEGFLQHTGMIARFDNILGRETIHTLEFLTSDITTIFSHPTMVDRIAAMLNYFLYHLVGPNKKNFKVKDHKEYEFNPASIVMDICKIYVHLHTSDSFCLAVSQDGRSYNPKLFTLAEDVLARIGGGALIADLQIVASKVAHMASQQQTEEEILAEAPEEFLDPIMSTLMIDPVILPSSRTTVDRSTIARHLLSDQTDPFNRSPLTMDLVKPNEELRQRIETWITERKEQHTSQSS